MADRSVKITVGANVAPLKSAMADGSKAVDGLANKSQGLGSKIKSGLAMAGITGGVLSLGAAIKGTFSLGLGFTEQLNTLQAVTGATADQMAKVSDKARQLGNDVEIPATSASDAAEAMTELAKGGLSVTQAMQAAKGTLQLAAAAQVSGAQAATIQANALNTFGLKASDAGHVADVLANTANAASGEITDFAQGMQQTGAVAKLFGIDIDDTSTALGLLANNGIKGSDAGTSLKTMLTQLATPSKNAQAAMDQLNLTVYDSQGRFVGLRSLTDQLSRAQSSMSQAAFQSAAGIVFGSDAIRAASVLASGGVSAYDDFKAAVERVGGAADLANAKMKGLPGALQQAENALQDVALQIYDALAPAVESVVRGFSDFIPKAADVLVPVLKGVITVVGGAASVLGDLFGWLSQLPGPVKTFGIALAGLALANKVGLLGKLSSAFETVSLHTLYAKDGLTNLGSTLGTLKGKVGELAKAFGPGAALAIGITLVANIISDARDQMHLTDDEIDAHKAAVESLGNAYQQSGGKITTAVRQQAWTDIKKNTPDIVAAAKAAGISMHDLVDAYLNVDSAGGKMARNSIENWAKVKDAQGGNWFTRTFGVWTSGAKDSQEASEKAAVAAQGFLSASKDAATAVQDETDAVGASTDATNDSTTATVKASAAQSRYTDWLNQRAAAGKDAAAAAKEQSDWDAKVATQAQKTAGNIADLSAKLDQSYQSAHDLTGQASQLESELARLSGRNVTVEQATYALNSAMQQMTDAAKDADGNVKMLGDGLIGANGSIKLTTASGRSLYDNVTALAKAAQDQALAVAEVTGKTKGQKAAEDAAAKSLAASRKQFIDNAKQMGLTANQAKKLADRYFGIPKNVKTVIKGDFTDVTARLQRLADTTTVIPIKGVYQGTVGTPASFTSGLVARASGGPVSGGRYLVGEKGPEILDLSPGSRGYVHNNGALNRAVATGTLIPRATGGTVIGSQIGSGGPALNAPIVRNVTYNVYGVPADSTETLVAKIDRKTAFSERL